jgi:hypothetical protein
MDSEKELEGLEREEASEKLAGSSLPPEMMARLTRAREARKNYELNKNKRIIYVGGTSGEFGGGGQTTNDNKRLAQNRSIPTDSDDAQKSSGNNRAYQTPYETKRATPEQPEEENHPEISKKNQAVPKNQASERPRQETQGRELIRPEENDENLSKNSMVGAVEKTEVGKFFNIFGNIQKGRKVLGTTTVLLMLSTFLLFDLTQALLNLTFVGIILVPIVDIFAILTMYVWFRGKGINLASPKRLKRMFIGAFIDVIPVLDVLPVWTGTVISMMGTLEVKPENQIPAVNRERGTKNVEQKQYEQAA